MPGTHVAKVYTAAWFQDAAEEGKVIMALFNIKKFAIATGVLLVIFVAGNGEASAQSRRDVERERQRIERENARYQRDRQRRYRDNRNDAVVSRRTEQRINNSTYSTGYQQGLLAGEYDRRSGKYNRSNVYRDTGASPNEGDPSSSDFIYRQGYLEGYNNGFHGTRNY